MSGGHGRVAVVSWSGTITALSSIHHGDQTRGVLTLLRRELLILPDGSSVEVPVISGNTFRGRLRRVAEELLREVLDYEGQLSPAAAHALRGGGSLVRTTREPLSGARLVRIRELLPPIGIFGAAGGGAIIDGALTVHKVIPHVRETNHLTEASATGSALDLPQVESYTRQDDCGTRDFAVLCPDGGDGPAPQMLFRLETFPAGTVFSAGLSLRRPSLLDLAFFVELLERFAEDGHLGGRVGIGHGRVRLDLRCSTELPPLPDWRAVLEQRRAEALAAIEELA